jgi:hypothetical protein
MATITITIGLNSNVTLAPLPAMARRRFVRSVRDALQGADAVIYVNGATSRGTWQDEATGTIVHEISRTWVADVADPDRIANVLPLLCATFEQDAIALTVGSTALVAA